MSNWPIVVYALLLFAYFVFDEDLQYAAAWLEDHHVRYPKSATGQFTLMACLLLAVLGVLFIRAIEPGQVMFSNDGPLGSAMSAASQTSSPYGTWRDLNWIGRSDVAANPCVTYALWIACGHPFISMLCVLVAFYTVRGIRMMRQ